MRTHSCFSLLLFSLLALCLFPMPGMATLPAHSEPILVVQNSASNDPYQNFVPELLRTEGLNGFQIAQLGELTSAFLANYDVIVLPHFALTQSQAALFQNYVSTGGTLVGFRPDPQLAAVFGVSPSGTVLSDAWLKINSATPYTSALYSDPLKFHGVADLYSLNGATALALLYNAPNTPTASPAAAIYTFGSGKAILFSFDLTQSIVLMRQGNPAWAGYPNNHDGFNTMRASQMFMDATSGQFWNDQGDGALNDVPQADIELHLFSNVLIASNSIKRPLPRFWYFPNKNRAVLILTGDHHGDPESDSVAEINAIQSFGGKFSEFLWYPFGSISKTQVSTWLAGGHAFGIHFDDTSEVDASGVGGSAASWNGMQTVLTSAVASFASTFPDAPFPSTTRDHFLIWLSRNASGNPDPIAQARLLQNAGVQFDTSFSSFPNRWGYMTGSGLPMQFLDTATGGVIPVYEQATQYEDDVQLGSSTYSTRWNLATAQAHYQKSIADSLTQYNNVIAVLFHPDAWSSYSTYAQSMLQYAQSSGVPMLSTQSWLDFWKTRAAANISLPSFSSNTLTFAVNGLPSGLTLLVPQSSGPNRAITTVQVDAAAQSFTVDNFQGLSYASIVLASGTHNVSITYAAAANISGQISPGADAAGTTVQVQGGSISQTVPAAADGTYVVGPLPPGTYRITPVSPSFVFSPSSRSITVGTTDVPGVNFLATANTSGQTLFTSQVPALVNNSDGTNYELGTVFAADAAGHLNAIRFWKDSRESGTHVGKIWSSSGQLLASVTFTGESASGWQQQALSSPLTIAANTTYVVSFNTAAMFYVATNGALASQIVNGNLRSVVGNNGVYGSAGTFPTNSYQNTNYFADIVFTPDYVSLTSLSLTPSTLTGGSSATGTLTLSGPAPTGGAVVSLLSDKAATVPATVSIPAGATTATFTVTTSPVATATTVNILGSYNGFQSATLTITSPSLSSLSLSPTSVTAGSSTTGTVTLTGPAPAGGTTVTLSDDNSAANTPSSVIVPQGATSATFTVTTSSSVSSNTTVKITASCNGGTQSATLTVTPSGGLITNLLKGVFKLL
jgi:hypothetical protein